MGLKVLIRVVFFLGATGAVLFLSAGRLNLPYFWVFLGLVAAAFLAMAFLMDPDLMRERMKPGPGGLDRSLRFVIMPFYTAHLLVAGLDAGRYHWSVVPAWLQVVGMICVAAGYGLSAWAARVNRFFSPVVRIQAERGHHLITGGPYRFIRHPGYLSSLLLLIAGGPALGSWRAMLANLVPVVLLFRRVILEDRFLHANLEGYADYARRCRYRLIPGGW